MSQHKKHSPRLVAYLNWAGVDDRERDELIKTYTKLFASSKLNAKIYHYAYTAEAAIIAVRFNGSDIDRVANCLDITASDLLSREVGLAMGDE
jgi:oligoendopeptidase F